MTDNNLFYKFYKWRFFHEKYGNIILFAPNYKKFWNILKEIYNVNPYEIKKNDTIFIIVENVDGSPLSEKESEGIFSLF